MLTPSKLYKINLYLKGIYHEQGTSQGFITVKSLHFQLQSIQLGIIPYSNCSIDTEILNNEC